MRRRTLFAVATVMVALLLICGCTGTTQPDTPVDTEKQQLRIATTTSLYDTKLLDRLSAIFEEEHNAEVLIVSAGTGKAIEYGQRGDVDVLMVHDRAREDVFLADGYGTNRRVFAYNYFIIVGPESDPAAIKGLQPEEAFTAIREKGMAGDADVIFVSRGDASGTHSKEKAIWKSAGFNYSTDVQGSGDWYQEAGTGMGATLSMTNEKQAYTLSDIGTYLAYKGDLDLVTLVDEGDILLNVYCAMQINPEKYPDINSTIAKDWINFMISDDVQKEIASFGVDQYGQPLFYAAQDDWEKIGVTLAEVTDPVL
ncbi:substrate-binding domain-containing protein [Methanoculleus bourgensis]|jgi:tungstate transport system substrate-binding protein|uniref:ABC transporter tungsten-binding protein n=2 Tax=Methanoculleus bourgensis TaxID=83986 RepID=A0A0X3BK12_9EURY|nr:MULTISPECIES: substrate-binding domain-containing protein [Methanoculleus]MBT0733843.1 substrate-binding domain-containing protein [Methanoculleus bourgensis]MDD3373483.1 substrate-binding domain-containing protein [Methanoculleus bourgensis]NMA88381.1 solute-binding protein [Methanoculleus bourgensis]NQS78584.1 solute-binding protein [Methanoculleus bourgensis]CVK31864.1 ABC transporter tungsten-binding protein [Methanoculleus bourgensis]